MHYLCVLVHHYADVQTFHNKLPDLDLLCFQNLDQMDEDLIDTYQLYPLKMEYHRNRYRCQQSFIA